MTDFALHKSRMWFFFSEKWRGRGGGRGGEGRGEKVERKWSVLEHSRLDPKSSLSSLPISI